MDPYYPVAPGKMQVVKGWTFRAHTRLESTHAWMKPPEIPFRGKEMRIAQEKGSNTTHAGEWRAHRTLQGWTIQSHVNTSRVSTIAAPPTNP
jgi:hypothetical protein